MRRPYFAGNDPAAALLLAKSDPTAWAAWCCENEHETTVLLMELAVLAHRYEVEIRTFVGPTVIGDELCYTVTMQCLDGYWNEV